MQFVRIRSSWFPTDGIDQIDMVGERVRVVLCNGMKIELDPIEGEKVLQQVEHANGARFSKSGEAVDRQPERTQALLERICMLEARLDAVIHRMQQSPKAGKAKANA